MSHTQGEAYAVNAHCLQSVVHLAKSHEVTASEDIVDARGMKLVAKGARIDEALYERLICFKLRKPLEVCIDVADGVAPPDLVRIAEQSLDELPALAACLRSVGAADAALEAFGAIGLDRVATLLLSMLDDRNADLRHSVQVTLIALGIGSMLGLGEGARKELAVAGMLHDVGELYVDTACRRSGRRLTPQEWKNIAAHPRIGQLVIGQMTDYPEAVAQAVAEHHERDNGFGYPRQLTGEKISALGKILMVAEALAGAAGKGRKELHLARLALLVIPREFPGPIVAPLSKVLAQVGLCDEDGAACEPADVLLAHQAHIHRVIERTLAWLDGALTDPLTGSIAAIVGERLQMLRSASFSTGLSGYGEHAALAVDTSLETRLEASALIGEIEWRLRELARLVWLKASMAPEPAAPFLRTLIDMLDGPVDGTRTNEDDGPRRAIDGTPALAD